ncbi:MAG: glycosyltransferase [Methanobrevibacter sp.]|nr:glycosyltransferase [Methanobrevibacter sp.]MBE6489641.1 glycosyltransferase [Methanobrevibacter sp.]
MSLITVNNFENMVNFKQFIRVIIIDNDNLESTKLSIDNVKHISNEIPISLVTSNDFQEKGDNVEIVQINFGDNYLEHINNLFLNKCEDFFVILNSGDILLDSFLKNLNFGHNLNEGTIGAVIYDDELINLCKSNYKPGFSPDLYLEVDYIFNSVFISRNAVNSIGGLDTTLHKNYIRDIIIRLYYSNYNIIKQDISSFKLYNPIYHDLIEDKIFLKKFIHNNNLKCDVIEEDNILKNIYHTQNKKASIIIPFKDHVDVTRKCVDSILNKTAYDNFEIILINNNSSNQKTFEFIDDISENPKVKIYDYCHSFNWSKINNFAASKSFCDVLVFLNNDTEVISPSWLDLLVGDAIQDNVGAVGAKLFFPDDTIQHVGVVIGLNSLASHLFAGINEEDVPVLYNSYRRNVSAVTGACLAIKRNLFNQIGGFNERFEVSFSDVEICLRLLKLGYYNIFNPDVKLYHHEMKTRSNKEFREIDRILGHSAFETYFKNGDPFFNKNYSLNNSRVLTLNNENEVPGFENYWKNWTNNRDKRVDKVHTIINKQKDSTKCYEYDLSVDDIIENGILMDRSFNSTFLKIKVALWFIPSLKKYCEDLFYSLFCLPNFLSQNELTNNIFVLSDYNEKEILEDYLTSRFPEINFNILKFDDVNNLPKSDVAFCFNWQTAFNLVKYNECDAKFYLINDDGNNRNLFKNLSYTFDFIGISNSEEFILKYQKYNNCIGCFKHFIDKDYYHVKSNIKKENNSILVHTEAISDDEFQLCVNSLNVINSYFEGNIKIYVLGREIDSSKLGLNNLINLGDIKSSKELSKIYNQCNLVLSFSTTFNVTNKILNSMACGCVNITTFNSSLPFLLRNNENVIISYQTVSAVSDDIIRILEDIHLKEKIINIGLDTINNIDSKVELEKISKFIKNPRLNLKNHHLINASQVDENTELIDNEYLINKLNREINNYKNNERIFKLINERNKRTILDLTNEVHNLKNNSRDSKSKNFFNKFR